MSLVPASTCPLTFTHPVIYHLGLLGKEAEERRKEGNGRGSGTESPQAEAGFVSPAPWEQVAS